MAGGADKGGAAAGSSSNSARAAEQQAKQSISHYISKLRQGDTAKWEKDELLNVIYWWRQCCGVLIGVLLGAGDVRGLSGIMMFFIISLAVTMGILKSILGIDEEEYGGLMELLFEGMMGSFASFMVAWILSFSSFHS